MTHTKNTHIANHRRKKRRKRSPLPLLIAVLVLLAAGGLCLWRFGFSDGSSKGEAKQETKKVQTKDLVIDTEEGEGDASGEDPRRVQNTATEENHKTNGLAICMYHYVYDEADPPEDLNNNYIEVHALEKELQYLVENDYFFPTWEEVRQYIDGDLLLPPKSVVLTFDDGAKSFLKLGAPLFEKYEVPVTSFLITSSDGPEKVETYAGDFLSFQSHSHNMHRAGGNIGHGGIFPAMPHADAVEDLKTSIEICGNGDAFAYPYGDYTDDCVTAVEDAGFLCAVTTEYGRANPGDNPMLLPRVRMLKGQSLESFQKLVE